jgi:hypothetical protein
MTWQRRQPGVVRLANLVLLGALFLVPAVAQPAPRFRVDAVSASPNPVNPGVTTTITASLTNTGSVASGVIVDLEIHDGSGQVVEQQSVLGQSFAAGETKALQWSWLVPGNQGFGGLTVKIGVFADHWSELYAWNNAAATLTVQQGSAVLAFHAAEITASPSVVPPGGSTAITARVTNLAPRSASGIHVLLELRDPVGDVVAGGQQTADDQVFAANETKSYTFTWTAPSDASPGAYSASIGVFDASWSRLYVWETGDAAFTVGEPSPPTFAAAATASPASVARGRTLSVTATVTDTSPRPAAGVIVDVELKNGAGEVVLQQWAEGQLVAAGEARSLVFVFQVPPSLPAGTYYVDVAVFSKGWATLYAYQWHAASFDVAP